MAEKSTIARPYAQAAFELARAGQDLQGWSDMLQFAASVAGDPDMADLIDNPRLERSRVVELFLEIAGSRLNELGQNFVRVLADNRRLALLPEIAEQYEHLRAEAEGTVDAEVVSAFPLTEAQRKRIANALRVKLGREVNLINKTDEGLIGGVVIRAGDLVIDGSAAGRLNRLANALLL